MRTLSDLFNKFCDLFATPLIQAPILIYFATLAERHYVALGHHLIIDAALLAMPVYFLAARPLLRRKGLV